MSPAGGGGPWWRERKGVSEATCRNCGQRAIMHARVAHRCELCADVPWPARARARREATRLPVGDRGGQVPRVRPHIGDTLRFLHVGVCGDCAQAPKHYRRDRGDIRWTGTDRSWAATRLHEGTARAAYSPSPTSITVGVSAGAPVRSPPTGAPRTDASISGTGARCACHRDGPVDKRLRLRREFLELADVQPGEQLALGGEPLSVDAQRAGEFAPRDDGSSRPRSRERRSDTRTPALTAGALPS